MTRTTPAKMFCFGDDRPMNASPYAQRLHDERAEDGARDRPDAAGERGAADDRRGDDVELVARSRRRASTPLSRADAIAAAMPHRMPIRMNVFMIVQRVLMPASSAASGLPP